MSLDEEKPLFSSHIFMFPFRFDWVDKGFENKFNFYKDKTIDERVNFSLEILKKNLKGWSYEPFDLKKDLESKKDYMYNEFAYFYDYARDAIYNLSGDESISYYFEKKIEDAQYHIDILKQEKPYILDITGLSLRMFNSGVGILSIELVNRQTAEFADILKINDYGRRIYPQFISSPLSKFKFSLKKLESFNIKPFFINEWHKTGPAKGSFLANKIKISGKDTNIEERFEFQSSNDIVIGSHIMDLLGSVFSQNKEKIKKYHIQPILDDRMFVISWHGNEKLSKQLVDENYIKNDDWYKYVFVDGKDKTVFSPKMQTELIQNATYDRWMNYEYGLTLYGVSRYSFVALTNASDFGKDKIRVDMESMYFQMITLLLATRASILRFSDEIAAVASDFDSNKLTKLYKRYLIFYNRLYFKEVTHQDQGIELYDIARKQMNIDNHMEKLDRKFVKLFEFSELQSSNNNSESMGKLTIMGALFLPPSLMVALFSMSIFNYKTSVESLGFGLIAIILSVIIGYVGIGFLKSKKTKFYTLMASAIFTVVFSMLFICSMENIGEKEKTSKPNIVSKIVKQVKSFMPNIGTNNE